MSNKTSLLLRWLPAPLFFFLFLLWSCNQDNGTESFFNLGKLADSLSGYDSIRVIVKSLDGGVLDTAFHGKVNSKNDLASLSVPHYQGEKVIISIVGYNAGVVVYLSDRSYDGTKNKTESIIPYILPNAAVHIVANDTQITEGDSVPLPSATLTPENLYDKTLLWSSSDSLTVSLGSLRYHGLKAGVAQLRVWLKSDSSKHAGFQVRVLAKSGSKAPDSLRLAPDTLRVAVNGVDRGFTLTAFPASASYAVKWSIQDSTVAVINASGSVHALKSGKVRAWVISQEDARITDTAWVISQAEVKVDSVRFVLDSTHVFIGGTPDSLLVKVYPSLANSELEWIIRDSSMTNITDGKVEGLKAGSTWVLARSKPYPDKLDSLRVIVQERQHVDSVVVKPDTLRLYTGGESWALKGKVYPEKGAAALLWRSLQPGIVSVDDTGKATPQAPGSTYILAVSQADTTRRDSSLIIVKRDVPILNVGRDTSVAVGQSVTFTPVVNQEYGVVTQFKWDLDGDGTWDDSASDVKPVTKTYSEAKEYPARFYVRDGEGNDTLVVKKVKAVKGPVVLILDPADQTYTNKTPIDISWSIDGVAQSALVKQTLVEGANTVTRTAKDSVGNSNSTSITVYLDTKAPEKPIVKGVTPTNTKTPTWTWTSGGGGGNGKYRYRLDNEVLDGAPEVKDTSYKPIVELSEGVHTLLVQERDAAGNWSISGYFAVRVDLTPPAAPKVSATSASPTNNPRPAWSWTGDSATGMGTYRLRLDTNDLTQGSTTVTKTGFTPGKDLADGVHTLYVQERDSAGNWSASGYFPVRVDLTPPAAPKVSTTTASPTTNHRPTWSWTGDSATGMGTYRLRLDTNDLTQGSTTVTKTGFTPGKDLADGVHTLYVQERDSAWNWSPSGYSSILVQTQTTDTTDTSDLAKERIVTINGSIWHLKSKLKAILMGDFTYGFNHTIGYPNLDSTIARIGNAENPKWTVDWIQGTSQVDSKITVANLSKYQVFFANYISGMGQSGSSLIPAASQTALQSFVEDSGKGIFLQHSSGDSRYNAGSNPWPWYFTIYPPQYNGSVGSGSVGSVGKIGVWGENNKAAKQHPVLQGITWNGSDSVTIGYGMELPTFVYVMTNPTIKPAGWQGLLGLNPSTCSTPNTCGNGGYDYTNESAKGGAWGYPISWTAPQKKGTVGYFMEGHDKNMMNAMTQAIWDRYYKQFMYYLAGYDSTLVGTSMNAPKHDLYMGVDRSGITFHPSEAASVLITKPGYHIVALYDIAGHKITEERGNKTPFDYNFSANMNGLRSGVYIMRVVVPGAARSGRVIVK